MRSIILKSIPMVTTMANPPPVITIESGRRLYRVLKREYDTAGNRRYTALDPNPYPNLDWINDIRALYSDGEAVAGRFSPFRSNGVSVAALYLAPTPETGYLEMVLRPSGNMAPRTLSIHEFTSLEVATVSFEDELKLADCRENYLKGGSDEYWAHSKDELFSARQLKCQDSARTLAKFIYENFEYLDGLVWDSIQHGNIVPVYMLFGDRRDGEIHHSIMALDDIPTWRPYLRLFEKSDNLVIAPDLAAIL